MTFYNYWKSLSEKEQILFAKNCDFSPSYIETHLIHRRKKPPLGKLKTMATASGGAFSFHDLCDFFVQDINS